jgi:hypothetical protein
MKKIVNLLFVVGLMLFMGSVVSASPIVASAVGAGIFVASAYLPSFNHGISFYTAGPATDVASIAKWAGMYSKTFINQTLNGLDIFKDLYVNRMVSRNGVLLPKFTAQGGLRPLNLDIEDNNATERSWSGRKLMVYDAMKLFKIVPEELISSFQTDMIAPGAVEIPFAQWVWMSEMNKLASEINDNFYLADYAGTAASWSATSYTFSSSTATYVSYQNDIYKLIATAASTDIPGTATTKWTKVNSLAIATGPGTIIAKELAASNLTAVSAASGSISSSNAWDKVQAMYNAMTVAHRNKGGVFRVSYDVYYKYCLQEASKFSYAASPESADGTKYVWGSAKKWEIRPCSWMGTSQRIIATQFENIQVGTNLAETPGINNMVPTLHGYKAAAKFLIGSEIADLECLYVNDQA